jgi:hypothetical protein
MNNVLRLCLFRAGLFNLAATTESGLFVLSPNSAGQRYSIPPIIIRAVQFIPTKAAATRCCWVINGVEHHVVKARIWSDHRVVNGSAALTMMMWILRKCGACDHCEDAKSS